jgi:prepilin-type N-terminal cleavage/methylation domain-containing protein
MRFRRPARSHGFSLIEVLVAMMLTGIVVAGTLKALTAQKKFYARQARILDARHAMRASTTILASELRELSAGGQDIYGMASDSIAIRSTVGFGVVCDVNGTNGTIGLTLVSGHFRMEAADSVLVFVENTSAGADDVWRALQVVGISTTGPNCANGAPAELVINATGVLSGIWPGAPLRLFRPYVYGLFQLNGRWFLGRRNRGGGAGYVPVAGPMAPPGDGGLLLEYRDSLGAITANPWEVRRVSISVKSPTFRSLTDPNYRSLSTSTYLRNDG